MLKTTLALLAATAAAAGGTTTGGTTTGGTTTTTTTEITKIVRTAATCTSPACKAWQKCGPDGIGGTKCYPVQSPCDYFSKQSGSTFTACTAVQKCVNTDTTKTLKEVTTVAHVECKSTECSATCTSTQVCKFGTCTAVSITGLSTALTDTEKKQLAKSGVDLSSGYDKVRTLRTDSSTPDADKISATKDFTIAGGEVADVEGTVTLKSLKMDKDGSDSTKKTLVNMKANSKVTLEKLGEGTAERSEIVFQKKAETKINLAEVAAGKKTRFALAEADTKTVIDSLDLKSKDSVLELAGKGLVELTNSKTTATPGKIEARGGIRLKGDIGNSPLVIEPSDDGTEEGEAEVEAELVIKGPIEGTGKLILKKDAAKAKISGTKNEITARLEMEKGELDMSGSSELIADKLKMTGGVAKFKTKKKGATQPPYVKTIESCDTGASMEFSMSALSDFTKGASESVLMTDTPKADADKFKCKIKIRLDDNSVKEVNMGTSLPDGITKKTFKDGSTRRLLSAEGSDLCGSWTGSSLEVSTGTCTPTTDSAVTASASLAVLAIAFGLLQ
jgi:hypothetical protein